MAFWKRSNPKTEADKIESAKVEPTPQRPVRVSVASTLAPIVENKPVEKSKLTLQESKATATAKPETSFDPYNSGAFDRRDTWGKVIRK